MGAVKDWVLFKIVGNTYRKLCRCDECRQNYVGWIPETLVVVKIAKRNKNNINLMMTVVVEGKETL